MIKFALTTNGRNLLENATAGINPVIIDSIVLKNGNTSLYTTGSFSGSVYNDASGIGEYIKIVLEISESSSYTITSISLKSNGIEIANSNQDFSVVKNENKGLKLELSCQFDLASRCGFYTYTASLPTATKFREGIIRLAGINGSEREPDVNREFTVYNAKDVDSKIDSITMDLSGHFVPWKLNNGTPIVGTVELNKIELKNTSDNTKVANISTNSNGKLSIDTTLTGNVVSSSPSITGASGSKTITGSDKVVNESYISSIYADLVSNANPDNSIKLVTSYAVSTYVTGAINTAISGLQEQIDALNAGQNLADIVDQISNLVNHSVTNLQARGKDDITIGDKIQVLHDKTDATGTVIPSADGVATVYELVYGTIDSVSYPKDQQSSTNGYYWHYIGEYGNDSYTKTESDDKYVSKSGLDQSILSNSSTTNAPSTKAVYDHVDSAISTASNNYAKLDSSNTFTGTTNTFNEVSATSYTGNGVYSSYDSSSWGGTANNSKIPTVETIKSAIEDSQTDVLNTLHTLNSIGSLGLFIYSGVGNEKTYGDTIDGQYLKPLAMSLSMSGQISYKAIDASSSLSGSWKLLSAAMKVTATEPCLVLAQKISNS